MDEDDTKQSANQELTRRELQRRSLDKIRVYNPTDEDYVLDWDGTKHMFPNRNKDVGYGAGMRVVERYIAVNFRREMRVKIINKMQQDELDALKEKLAARGDDNVDFNANKALLNNNKYRTDNPELVKKLNDQIWLGVEEQYGLDYTPPEQTPINIKTELEKLDELVDDRPYVPKQPTETPKSEPLEEKADMEKQKQDLVQEVSK